MMIETIELYSLTDVDLHSMSQLSEKSEISAHILS